jgi:N-acetylneuraminic acid mutarotase
MLRIAAFGLAFASALTLATLRPASADEGGTWSHKAPMPGVRSETAAAVVDGRIYVIGGNTSEARDGKSAERYDAGLVEVYDPNADTWRPLAPMPEGSGHNATAVLDGTIYVAGGFKARLHSKPVTNFYAYHPTTDSWETLPPLLRPRGSANLAAVDGKLHLLGGRIVETEGAIADHDVYDPRTRTWTKAAPLPTARDHMAVAVIGGRIHVYGGRTKGADANVTTHEVFDPKTGAWTTAAPMPVASSGGAFALYHGLAFFLGGECRNRATYDETQAYDPTTDSWRLLAPLPEGRHAVSAATVGGTLYVIGGATGCGGNGKVTDNLTFTLP